MRAEERAAGVAVVDEDPSSGPRFLLIRDRFGRWALPKGHIDPGETAEEAAVREVSEETGIETELLRPIGTVHYLFWREGLLRRKRVDYFLGQKTGGRLRAAEGEIDRARWVGPEEFARRIDYPNNEPIYRAALREVLGEREEGGDR